MSTTNHAQTPPAPEGTPPQVPAKKGVSHSERFTQMVMREFSGNVSGVLHINDYQRRHMDGGAICTLSAIGERPPTVHSIFTAINLRLTKV